MEAATRVAYCRTSLVKKVLIFGPMSWFKDTIFELVRLGGEEVVEEHFAKRVQACNACPHVGDVNPLPGIVARGCTLCKCPLDTKARLWTYFSPTKLKVVPSRCTLVEKGLGDNWAGPDADYQQLYKNESDTTAGAGSQTSEPARKQH